MKTNESISILSLCLPLLISWSPALAETRDLPGLPRHWVRSERKQVHFAPDPTLKLKLTHLGADEDYWDQLNVDLKFNGPSIAEQASALEKAYPGHELKRVILGAKGEVLLGLPALDLQLRLRLQQSTEGPYLSWSTFVPRSRSQALADALAKSPPEISLTGVLSANVPVERTLERVELGHDVCALLAERGRTVHDVIRSVPKADERVDSVPARLESTREALRRNLLSSCLELPAVARVRNVQELLSLSVDIRSGARPFGETRGEVPVSQELGLRFQVSAELPGVRGFE